MEIIVKFYNAFRRERAVFITEKLLKNRGAGGETSSSCSGT